MSLWKSPAESIYMFSNKTKVQKINKFFFFDFKRNVGAMSYFFGILRIPDLIFNSLRKRDKISKHCVPYNVHKIEI